MGTVEGTPFGRYRLQQMIGRGGMGEVWRAFDTETDRVVAIKLLPTQFASDDEFLLRFRREARVAAGLQSPNVVPIHNFGEIDGKLYVDMQLIAGRDLQAVLEAGPLPPQRAVRIVEQVASALKAAHAAGLVHRDVKPSNVLLNDDDFAYLIDFGLARTSDDAGLTVTGHTVGTYAYMAPERYESGGAVDARTDVYSLACVLFQCLTGRRPFAGTGAQQMLAHVTTPPPRPSDVIPSLPRAFDAVIATGMAKDVAARYQTIDDLARAARAALDDDRTAPNVPSAPWPAARSGPVTQMGWNPSSATTQFGTTPAQFGQPAPLPSHAPPPPGPQPWHHSAPPMPPLAPRRAPAPWWRRKPVVIAAALLAVVALVLTSVVLVTSGGDPDPGPVADPDTTKVGGVTYGKQLTMPATGLSGIEGIATTLNGSVVGLCCQENETTKQVFNINVEGKTPPKINRLDIVVSSGVAADNQGNGYVAEAFGSVFRIDGAAGFVKLAFPPMHVPGGVAVDPSGAVYVVDRLNAPGQLALIPEVWKLDFGAPEATRLPFDASAGQAIAVNPTDGTVYVTDAFSPTVQKLEKDAPRASALALPSGGKALGVAVGSDGAVYVTAKDEDGKNSVYRFAPDADTADRLPITGVGWTEMGIAGIAVDKTGNVFVADWKNNRVVKLPRKDAE